MIKKNSGQILYSKAKKIIPGGTMLFSKRPELILPDFWPTYYSRAKGVNIWDLDNIKFIDMTLMGVGTNSLGYANKNVDFRVKEVVRKSNLSSLNCPEEVYLGEKLLSLNPWADMVRFARTGGEANSIAIRISRAASNKDKVAVCGYHGWHDWYLAANLSNSNSLNGHSLDGLNMSGVPENLKDTVFPFSYNDFDSLERIVSSNDIGTIKMEVVRSYQPKNNFLEKVRDLASKKNIVLIFDECSSGFRETFGGIYSKYNVEPDIIIFGKTLGNGYGITSVLGKREIMENAQNTFISSTFWTERIGPTAALATLNEMEKIKSWEVITRYGKIVRDGWIKLANLHNLEIEVKGIPAISTYEFKSKKNQEYKTYVAQEMLKKGILASTFFYASTAHNSKLINLYLDELDSIFQKISNAEKGIISIDDMLDGPVCNNRFVRLN